MFEKYFGNIFQISIDFMYHISYNSYISYRRDDYMSDNERKRFTTTINPDILLNFKVSCIKQGKDMNEILELLMVAFSDGIIGINDISEE